MCLRAPAFAEQINKKKLGTAVLRLNLEDVREMTVPCIELPAQDEAAKRVERIMCVAEGSANEATRALALLDHLEKSILARAFRGELVPQDAAETPAAMMTAKGDTGPTSRPRRGRPRKVA